MFQEPEINALNTVYEILKDLNRMQIKRIIEWISSRFELTKKTISVPITSKKDNSESLLASPPNSKETVESTRKYDDSGKSDSALTSPPPSKTPTPLNPQEKLASPDKGLSQKNNKQKDNPSLIKQPSKTAEPTTETKINIMDDFSKYETFEELFLFSNTKSLISKVLLTAAYLQEKEKIKELSSNEISSALKSLGEDITNPSQTIKSLIEKNPPLLTLTESRAGKHSRKKFTVTNAGLEIARGYIKQ